ncbi:MAG: hypothetical protein Tsb0010_04920 [Parvularculaceae bacterium]
MQTPPKCDNRTWRAAAAAAMMAAQAIATQTAALELPAERAAQIDEIAGKFEKLSMFDGAVLIDIGGEIVFERYYGMAQHEFGVPHSAATRFRIASVSKPMTDAALAALIERGEISIEDTVNLYLPDFPRGDEISILDILQHRSGIPHTNDQPWGDGRTVMPLDEIVARLAALPLDFEPGSRRNYSNGGFAVLAKILEVVSGESYGALMIRYLFDPLGLADSGHISDSRAVIDNIATGYEPGPGGRRHARFYAAEMRPGGGSLYSTPRDVRRFAAAVFRERFPSADVNAAFFGNGDNAVQFSGRSPGFDAQTYFDPSHDVIAVVLKNNYSTQSGLAEAFARIAVGDGSIDHWWDFEIVDETVADDHPMIGPYAWPAFIGARGEFHKSEGGALLFTDRENGYSSPLWPMGDNRFLFALFSMECGPHNGGYAEIACRSLSADDPLILQRLDEPR